MTVDGKSIHPAHAAAEATSGEQLRTLVQLLRLKAASHPDRRLYTFLADGESEEAHLTYGELDGRARAVAALLQKSHARGERALLLYPAGLDFIAAFFGCLYAGIVPVPTYPPHPARLNRTTEKLLALLHDAQPSLALTNTELLTKSAALQSQIARLSSLEWLATDNLKDDVQEAWRDPQVDERTLAFLQYTSGSTAAPKGVMVSHGNLLHNQRMIKAAFAQTDESVIVGWLPLYHDMGLIGNVLHPLYVGASCLLMSPLAFVQRPLRWLQAITKYRATTSGGPDFAYQLCARKITERERELLDLSSWRVAFNGAEPIRSETLDLFTATFSSCGFRREAWVPCYGLAESTLFVSGGVKEESRLTRAFQSRALEQGRVIEESTPVARTKTLVSCGRPSTEQRVIIVDPATLSERPDVEVGEIWTSSESVALGYWNRETETEETFRATLAGQNKGPFLRTGDLGFLHQGELFVTGRHKDLIIIRGRNFYPQDIEQTVERCHASFRANSGAAFSIESDGGELLVVLQELDPRHASHETEDLAQAIRQAVALQHELKIYDVLLLKAGSIPKTSSGKTQRRACRELYLSGSLDVIHRDTLAESTAWLPPDETIADLSSTSFENPLDLPTDERAEALDAYLLNSLSDVLGISSSRLHREQSLNAVGLDSLGALELKGRVETELGLDIPLTKFLDDSTIADLTAFLLDEAASNRISQSDIQPIARSEKKSQYELSSGQRALWFMHQLAPASAAYIIARAVRILSALDEAALRSAFQTIVDRHAALRTTFITREGEPLQQVSEDALISFVTEDGSGWSDERLRERLSEVAYQPFDLESGPLLRVHLFKRGGDEHTLLLSVHHIVADFWSIGLLVHELGQLYDALTTGQPLALEFLDLQFMDYVAWERASLAGLAGERLWDFWREQLAGELPVLNLQTDYPRPPVQTYRGSAQPFKLGRELTKQLKALSREEGSTLYVTLLAVFNVLLFRYTGQPEILVGSPTSGRHRAGFKNLIGYFVNPLVHRSFPDGDKSFQTFLQEVRRTVVLGLEHQDFPFPLLVERLQLSRDPSRAPLFQAMFALQKTAQPDHHSLNALAIQSDGQPLVLGQLKLETLALEQQSAQFDLALMMAEVDGELGGHFEYNSDLFETATIERMAGHFEQLLLEVINGKERKLSQLRMLTAEEEAQVVHLWNDTRADYASHDENVVALFEHQVERAPHALALEYEAEHLTYQQLNERANRLAHYLRSKGVGAEVAVGLLLERSVEMVVGILAVLKAGGCYVPLDVSYPVERVQYMIEDAKARVVLTQSGLRERLGELKAEVIAVDEEVERIERESVENVGAWIAGSGLAYIIYTSGSTGQPKGAMNTHAGIRNRLLWMQDAYNLNSTDKVLQKTPYTFDVSVWEFLWPLMTGAGLVVARPGGHQDSQYLVNLIIESEITTLHFVPSMLRVFLEEKNAVLCRSLRRVICSGEALPFDLQQRFFSVLDVELHNLYGPTEAAVDVTYWDCRRRIKRLHGSHAIETQTVPIGRPIANTQIYLLDQSLQPVPVGASGELFIGGSGVARGYLNRPDLTAERFIPDPFSSQAGARLYRTGDLARYLPDGPVEFLGRLDHQVKIRGFRIELGEIESSLLSHRSVRESVVLALDDKNAAGIGPGKRLIAYLTVEPELPAPSAAEMRQHLQQTLPDYMLPAAFIVLDRLPLNPNGKVDRRALPAPDEQARLESGTNYEPPLNETEELLTSIWADLLGQNRVGRTDNFFALGGHSLLATQVAARVRTAFDVELPMTVFFQEPTVAGLARVISQSQPAISNADHINELLNALEQLSEEEVEALLEQQASPE